METQHQPTEQSDNKHILDIIQGIKDLNGGLLEKLISSGSLYGISTYTPSALGISDLYVTDYIFNQVLSYAFLYQILWKYEREHGDLWGTNDGISPKADIYDLYSSDPQTFLHSYILPNIENIRDYMLSKEDCLCYCPIELYIQDCFIHSASFTNPFLILTRLDIQDSYVINFEYLDKYNKSFSSNPLNITIELGNSSCNFIYDRGLYEEGEFNYITACNSRCVLSCTSLGTSLEFNDLTLDVYRDLLMYEDKIDVSAIHFFFDSSTYSLPIEDLKEITPKRPSHFFKANGLRESYIEPFSRLALIVVSKGTLENDLTLLDLAGRTINGIYITAVVSLPDTLFSDFKLSASIWDTETYRTSEGAVFLDLENSSLGIHSQHTQIDLKTTPLCQTYKTPTGQQPTPTSGSNAVTGLDTIIKEKLGHEDFFLICSKFPKSLKTLPIVDLDSKLLEAL